jgi:hypothetical protein
VLVVSVGIPSTAVLSLGVVGNGGKGAAPQELGHALTSLSAKNLPSLSCWWGRL